MCIGISFFFFFSLFHWLHLSLSISLLEHCINSKSSICEFQEGPIIGNIILFGFGNVLTFSMLLLYLLVGTLARTIEKPVAGTDLDTKFRLVDDDDSNKCMGYDTDHDFNNAFIDNEVT